MAKIKSITDLVEWQSLWQDAKAADAPALLILKRSPICPTSLSAEATFNRFVAELPENPKLRIYSVDVIAARPISQRIAADTTVRHESPQALLIKGGQQIAWHASHGDIDDERLERSLSL